MKKRKKQKETDFSKPDLPIPLKIPQKCHNELLYCKSDTSRQNVEENVIFIIRKNPKRSIKEKDTGRETYLYFLFVT
jgi:hypothetical protein